MTHIKESQSIHPGQCLTHNNDKVLNCGQEAIGRFWTSLQCGYPLEVVNNNNSNCTLPSIHMQMWRKESAEQQLDSIPQEPKFSSGRRGEANQKTLTCRQKSTVLIAKVQKKKHFINSSWAPLRRR